MDWQGSYRRGSGRTDEIGRLQRGVVRNRRPSQYDRLGRVVGSRIIGAQRSNSAHLHRPWRAISPIAAVSTISYAIARSRSSIVVISAAFEVRWRSPFPSGRSLNFDRRAYGSREQWERNSAASFTLRPCPATEIEKSSPAPMNFRAPGGFTNEAGMSPAADPTTGSI